MLNGAEHHDDFRFRAPIDLSTTRNPAANVLVIGSCLVAGLPEYIETHAGYRADYLLFNLVGNLPEQPPRPLGDYAYQIVQIALRSVLPETLVMRATDDEVSAQDVFAQAAERLDQLLEAAMAYNRETGLLTAIPNFLVPQQNPLGRLLPRYDLRNPAYLIERLNERLHRSAAQYKNTYVVDFDGIAAGLGKKYVQDDGIAMLSHGAVLSDGEYLQDAERIQPAPPLAEHYTIHTYDLSRALWHEIEAMRRTLDQRDNVKLVIVDLDDTLWRGVVAEAHDFAVQMVEGWPLGVVEALLFLKRRGIMLGIVSKNDESAIRSIWQRVFSGRLLIDDFVSIKINWNSKADNVADMLGEVNVLANAAVFIDDNPVERQAVKLAFPEIRALGEHPYFLRRILLWAPETQVGTITGESARRTTMVQGQIVREGVRARMSREDFLASLSVRLTTFTLRRVEDERFPRVLELINKTNQFNTTGVRWSASELGAWFKRGGRAHAFSVTDRFSDYGLVGVMLTRDFNIEQMVMSCRVVGLEVEIAAISALRDAAAKAGWKTLSAALLETSSNTLCRDLFSRCGFAAEGERQWVTEINAAQAAPAHIAQEGGYDLGSKMKRRRVKPSSTQSS